MKIRFGWFLVVCCLALSITAASAGTVNMTLANMGDKGWTSVITVDSSGRGGIYEKVGLTVASQSATTCSCSPRVALTGLPLLGRS
mgnify:CR=1 FL=1